MRYALPTTLASLTAAVLLLSSAPLRAADGGLVAAFGTNGKTNTDFSLGSANDIGTALAIDGSGKAVVVGQSTVSLISFAIARYTTAGALDTTFNSAGVKPGTQITSVGDGISEGAYAVAIQSDGKIVVAGYATNGTNNRDFAIIRYTTAGALDLTFGGGTGKVLTDFGGLGNDEAHAVAITGTNIVVAGVATIGSKMDFALARYDTNGALDTTFNPTGSIPGTVTTAFGTLDDVATALAIQSDGKIVVAGYGTVSSSIDFELARYTSTGVLDTTFDVDGMVTTDVVVGSSDYAYGLAIQADGKIVAAGYTNTAGGDDIAVARYTTAGALDTTFNTTGTVVTDFGGSSVDRGYGVVVQTDGRIVVGGTSNRSGLSYDFALIRYSATGSVDTSFGGTGKVTTSFGTPVSAVRGLAFTGGQLVAAGTTSLNNNDFAIARYDATATTNTAPTISTIPNQSMASGASVVGLPVTVTDAESVPGALTLTAASSNTALVANSAITFGGSGPGRTVSVTSTAGQTGTTTITLTVSDGLLTATSTFTVTVVANTAAPTISPIADQTTAPGVATAAIAFSVSDTQTPAAFLSVSASSSDPTLVPGSSIVLGGSGATRTITVTPVAGPGSVVITVTVSDGSLSSSTAFTVTVTAPPNSGAKSSSSSCGSGGLGVLILSLGGFMFARRGRAR